MLIAANGRLLIVDSSVEVNGHSLPVKERIVARKTQLTIRVIRKFIFIIVYL